jgi:hypothetical protein
MRPGPPNPILYEIHAFVWLREISRRYGRPVRLGCVPAEEWESLAGLGVDLVWLMGVWQRSPAALEIVRHDAQAMDGFRAELPNFHPEDLSGSPYAVRDYHVDPAIGGDEGLAIERARLAQYGMGLVLDFVPNHVAPDHPWVFSHPEYFVQGTSAESVLSPHAFLQVGEQIYARGKDPNFPAWEDVLQLNAFDPGLRAAVQQTLLRLAGQCDGLRVDMAMLLINRIFAATWGLRAGAIPESEFWPPILQAVHQTHPSFQFIAETYWGTEPELLSQGFDFCYDKGLYDELRDHRLPALHTRLQFSQSTLSRLVHFSENHDEPRALVAFSEDQWRVAAITAGTLPGLRMFYEGQLDGRRTRVSVLLARWPKETPDPTVRAFYQQLIPVLAGPPFRTGRWQPLPQPVGEDAFSPGECLAWTWEDEQTTRLVLINLAAQPRWLALTWPLEHPAPPRIEDLLSGQQFCRADLGDGPQYRVLAPARNGLILAPQPDA